MTNPQGDKNTSCHPKTQECVGTKEQGYLLIPHSGGERVKVRLLKAWTTSEVVLDCILGF